MPCNAIPNGKRRNSARRSSRTLAPFNTFPTNTFPTVPVTTAGDLRIKSSNVIERQALYEEPRAPVASMWAGLGQKRTLSTMSL